MNKVLAIALSLLLLSTALAQDNGSLVPEADVEPMLRGPIHEAFAEPIQLTPQEALVVPQEPPPPVEEVPPEARPAGDNVQWVPGYWAWDDERNDFIWVSGVWRRVPVGREWSPGAWQKADQGYRWVPGRWSIAASAVDDQLLPPPPDSLEEGPTSEPRSEDDFWVPGSWQYRENRYAWRPGFWSACHENWIWIPDYYVASTDGCYYVPGYWDYGWEQRGTLFAPCYFKRHDVGLRYRPRVVIDFAGAFSHLWVRPGYCHYYFGDYYDDRYIGWGFQPWYRYHFHHRRAYDPLYVHYRWRYNDYRHLGLHRQLHDRYAHYRDHKERRPAHSYRDYQHRGPHDSRVALAHRVEEHQSGAARRNRVRGDVLQLRSEANEPALTRRGGNRGGREAVRNGTVRRSIGDANRVVDLDDARRSRRLGESGRSNSRSDQPTVRQQVNDANQRSRGPRVNRDIQSSGRNASSRTTSSGESSQASRRTSRALSDRSSTLRRATDRAASQRETESSSSNRSASRVSRSQPEVRSFNRSPVATPSVRSGESTRASVVSESSRIVERDPSVGQKPSLRGASPRNRSSSVPAVTSFPSRGSSEIPSRGAPTARSRVLDGGSRPSMSRSSPSVSRYSAPQSFSPRSSRSSSRSRSSMSSTSRSSMSRSSTSRSSMSRSSMSPSSGRSGGGSFGRGGGGGRGGGRGR